MSEEKQPTEEKKEKKEPKPEKEKKPKKEKAPKQEKPAKTKICPACKAEIPKKAKLCPQCAAKQKGFNPLPIIVPLLLILVGAVSVFVFHFPVDPPFELPFAKEPEKSPLAAAMDLSKKEEEAVIAVFEQCGVAEIVEAKERSSNGTSSVYVLNDAETSLYEDTQDAIIVQINDKTKTVDSIDYRNHPVYRGGQVVAQATDFYLDSTERDEYLALALTAVKAELEFPELASFHAKSGWDYTMEDERVTVRSTVSVKTSGGGTETRPFQVNFAKGEFVSIDLGAPLAS